LILDADGVFLSERPYWNTAIATALWRSDLTDKVNGNWDLAAVLSHALRDALVAERVARRLESGQMDLAVMALEEAVEDLAAVDGAESPDPLGVFGIDRGDEEFESVVTDFQRVFEGELDLGWSFPREVLSENRAAIAAAFRTAIDLGYELRVCTGRHRKEIEMPIQRLGLDPYLASERLTCADEVDRAEGLTGQLPLGKPHWFAPVCSVLGFDQAVVVLGGSTIPAVAGRRVYVGDAAADFRAVQAANELGLEMRYIHVRSGASWEELEEFISDSPLCLGLVDRLGELPPLLEAVQR
jgi:phosphoglycolate phosphatase-like HAD superfamily hydrolase